jgi:large subunit ribosomal protein L25
MEKFKLKLEKKEAIKPNQLRKAGKIPATIYGPGVDSQSFQVDAKEFSKLPPSAYSHIIDLVDSSDKPISTIIRHVQRKFTAREILNIEFYRIASDRKLTVNVPFKFVGTSPAVTMGGQLVELHQEAEVECFPADIPDFIEIDVSAIVEIDTGIHFADLKVSDKIEILNPSEEIIVRVITPRKVVEEAPVAAAEGAEAAAEGAAEAAPAGDKKAAPADAAKKAEPAKKA